MGQLAVASGFPQMQSLGSPEIWSPKLNVKFYDATVFGAISNTDYEGEITKKGCKVHIRTTPDISIRPYTDGMQLTHQKPAPGKIELDIDQASFWDFIITDVARFQGDINYMEDWTTDASEGQRIYVDTVGLNYFYQQASAYNKGSAAGKKSGDINLGVTGTPVEINSANIVEKIVDCGVCLDEQSVPSTGRFIVLPAWCIGKLKISDLKDASMTGDGKSILRQRNGRVGMIDRFEVYDSNLLASVTDTVTCWHAVFGQRAGLTFASQFVENQVLSQVESTFGAVCRGLQVFGMKALKTEAIGDLYIKKGAES